MTLETEAIAMTGKVLADVMTRDVALVRAGTPFREVVALLSRRRISGAVGSVDGVVAVDSRLRVARSTG
jgi:CBS domain-containing protein